MSVLCRGRGKRERVTRNLLGWLCAIFIAFGATVRVAHFHSDSAVHSDCAICHAAHLTVETSTPETLSFVVRPIARIVVAPRPTCAITVFSFSLWDRPPPVAAPMS
jgi:hypothetical protein